MTETKPPYTRQELIGRGSYGAVYKGIHNETKQVVAIKVLNLDTTEDDVADIQREISMLSQLKQVDAQNVVRYHGSFLYDTRLWVIMDFCEGGSIRTLMKSCRIEEKYLSVIIREILIALNCIHRAGIIHRDIKAANILVTNEGQVQLCDFGVAAQLSANNFKRSTFAGTPYWMAPEVITEGVSYNFKADIWSLGITVYEIATGNPPFADQEPMRAIILIPRSPPTRLEGSQFSSHLKEFVAICLNEDVDERPSAIELLKTKFIKQTMKTPTTILKELLIRYDLWCQHGGMRNSLNVSANDENNNDENFELDNMNDRFSGEWAFDTIQSYPENKMSDLDDKKAANMSEKEAVPFNFSYSKYTQLNSVPVTNHLPDIQPTSPLRFLNSETLKSSHSHDCTPNPIPSRESSSVLLFKPSDPLLNIQKSKMSHKNSRFISKEESNTSNGISSKHNSDKGMSLLSTKNTSPKSKYSGIDGLVLLPPSPSQSSVSQNFQMSLKDSSLSNTWKPPPLAPLNLKVLSDYTDSGENTVNDSIISELERVLLGFQSYLEILDKGLSVIQKNS
ncbi:hypothetical protein PCK1_001496 [Pneumocystis canis]|nr:hypothetical protein PCK1_001496 [Pneumocystis canis]